MKYAFIINPASGQGKAESELVPQIDLLISAYPDRDISKYYTSCIGDASVIADRIAAETDEEIVIFACGGDGTIQEVANGIFGHDNAILGIVPVGSGNDFVRAIGRHVKAADRYKNLPAQLVGNIKKMDLLKMSFMKDGEIKYVMVDNGINIGFDGNAAILASEYKKLPLVQGTAAYVLAVGKCLILKKGQKLRITADGKEFHSGPLLLATAANGGFCGGGFESCPRADLFDGLIELLVVNNLSRLKFISLVPKYQKGKLFDIPPADLYKYTQAKEIIIEPMMGQTMKFVADGEIFETGTLKIEIVPGAIKVLEL